MSTFFKIRSTKTGLFSTGGNSPKWSSIGKIWPVRGHLSSHFTNLSPAGRREYENHGAEVVECEFVTRSQQPVSEFVAAAQERKQAREDGARKRRAERQRQQDLIEFERLGRRLGKL